MIHILKIIYAWFFRIRQQLRWGYEAKCIHGQIHESKPLLDLNHEYIVLIPHSDDEWIGNSMIIRKAKNVLLVNLDMQGGDTPELHAVRYNEMSNLAEQYHRTLITIKDEKSRKLADILNQHPQAIITVPAYIDWHPEHIEVMNILAEAVRTGNIPQDRLIAMQPVSVPMPQAMVTNVLPMDKVEWKEKWSVFRQTYTTQLLIPHKRFALHETISGSYSDSHAAEVYSLLKCSDWLECLPAFKLSLDEISTLKSNLNNIRGIYNVINSIYNNSSKKPC